MIWSHYYFRKKIKRSILYLRNQKAVTCVIWCV